MTTATLDRPRQRRPQLGALASRALQGLRVLAGCFSLAAIVGISLRIATAAASHATFLVPSGRRAGYPAWMRGPFAHVGTPISLRSFIVLMALMAVAWVVTLLCAQALPRWVVPAAILTATATFAVAPPLLSSDVFNYIAYGRMAMRGINPYAHGPAALAADPVYPYTGHLWKHDPSAYGPLFTAITQLLAPLGTAVSFWALKLLTALSALATTALVWLTAQRLNRPPAFAAALVALNPLVLVYAVGGAHNDLLMAAVLALCLYLAVRRAPGSSGAALAGAVAVKLSAGLVAPFLLLGVRPRQRVLAGLAGATVLLGVGAFALYGSALRNMPHVLSKEQHFNWIVVSIPGFVGHYLGFGHLTTMSRHVLLGIFAAAVVALVVRTLTGGGWLEAAGWATLALLLTTAWLLPWYVLWVLPFAALLRKRALPAAVVVVTLLLLVMQLDHFWLTRHSHRLHHHHARVTQRAAKR